MAIENIERRLVIWKQVLLVSIGASLALLAMPIAELLVTFYPGSPSGYSGWYVVWSVVQIATMTLGVILLSGRGWRDLPLSTRLNTIFGYLTTGWVTLLAFGFKVGRDDISSELIFLIIGIGVVIGLGYWWLCRSHVNAPEEMFP